MTYHNASLPRRVLMLAASMVSIMALAVLIAVGTAQPAFAQNDEGEEVGPLTKGRLAGEAFLDGLTGPDSPTENAEEEQEGSGDGGSGDGDSGESSGSGGSGGGGGDWDSSGGGGMSEEAQNGRFGPWTGIINLLLGLLSAAGGIGIASGIGLLATAHGSDAKIEVGKKVLEGSLGGFLIGTMAIPVYEVVTRVVIGF